MFLEEVSEHGLAQKIQTLPLIKRITLIYTDPKSSIGGF
jgi:hypothetical protein